MDVSHEERRSGPRRPVVGAALAPALLAMALGALGGGCVTGNSTPVATAPTAMAAPPTVLPGLVLPSNAQTVAATLGGSALYLAPDDPAYGRRDVALIGDGGARELPASVAVITLDDWQWTVNGSPRDYTRFRTRSAEAATRR